MSLDVYLKRQEQSLPDDERNIVIAENDAKTTISRKEWDRRFPGQEPMPYQMLDEPGLLYTANITHNLTQMAAAAGIYQALWRPHEINATHAADLIAPLTVGIAELKANPTRYKEFNAANGWGKYENLVAFAENYLTACQDHPTATVSVWV